MTADSPFARLRAPALRFSGRQIVGIVGNEGAVFVRLSGRQVLDHRYVPTPDPDGADAVQDLLAQDRKAPVTLLIDVLEQHYRETSIPKLNWFDRRKLIKRKLDQAYGEDHLTSYLPLARRTAGEVASQGESAAAQRYVLIGVPDSDELDAWMDIVAGAGNPLSAVTLLPVEGVDLVRKLAAGDDDKSGSAPAWQILITRQRASGFRQIILHNGQLVFTRLTPNIEPDAPVDEIVENIEAEFRSTLSYLRRLSFTDADHLQLTIVDEAEVCAQIDHRRMRVRDARAITPAEAAESLGLNVYDGEDADGVAFADLLIAAWFAGQGRVRLNLTTPQLRRARLLTWVPRATAAAGVATAAIGGVYLGLWYMDVREKEARLAQLQAGHDRAEARLATLEEGNDLGSVNLDRFAVVVDTREALGAVAPRYGEMLRQVSAALPEDMIVTRLSLDPGTKDASLVRLAKQELPDGLSRRGYTVHVRGAAAAEDEDAAPDIAARAGLEATVRLLEPPADRPTVLIRYDRLRRNLAGRLPAHRVELAKQPFDSERSRPGENGGPPVIEGVLRVTGAT